MSENFSVDTSQAGNLIDSCKQFRGRIKPEDIVKTVDIGHWGFNDNINREAMRIREMKELRCKLESMLLGCKDRNAGARLRMKLKMMEKNSNK